MNIHEYISDLIGMELALVRHYKSGKDNLIVHFDNNESFNLKHYNGYVRILTSDFVDKIHFKTWVHTAKVVLFFKLDKCINEILAKTSLINVDYIKNGIERIQVKRVYLDTIENIKRELQADKWLDYKVIIIDIEASEIICKPEKCN